MIDDDRSGACVAVNKVESDNEDKLHAASSSDSDSEGEEEQKSFVTNMEVLILNFGALKFPLLTLLFHSIP